MARPDKGAVLRELLEAHDAHAGEGGLRESVGDGYLYHRNPVFRNVRNVSRKLGFTYALGDLFHYRAYSLLALPQILESRRIPYFDNVSPLRHLEALQPGAFRSGEMPAFYMNHSFHESCHGIADAVVPPVELHPGDFASEREVATDLIMKESFANCVESFGCGYLPAKIDRVLYGWNSFIDETPRRAGVRKKVMDTLGPSSTFKLTYVSYLFSNFLYEHVEDQGVDLALALVAPGARLRRADRQVIAEFFRYSFTLSVDFRTRTLKFYLRMLGMKHPAGRLLAFNFLKTIFRSEQHLSSIERFSQIVTEGKMEDERTSSLVRKVA
jgi:hypothetical protein